MTTKKYLKLVERRAATKAALAAAELEARGAAQAAYDKACAAVKAAQPDNDFVKAVAPYVRDALRIGDRLRIGYGLGSVRVVRYESRDKYSKKWHQSFGPATETETTVFVPCEWLEEVQAKGLAVVDGMLTLAAAPVEAPAGYEAFKASWARNGRGYDAITETGFIVRAPGRTIETAHGATVKACVATLRRRARAEWAREAARTADLEAYRDVHVLLADSRAVGNCETGARHWANRAGLDADKGATVGEILNALAEGAGLDGMAINACRHAIARAMVRKAA